MIRSFKTKETESIWLGESIRHVPMEVQIRARRKLRLLNNARSPMEMQVPPGNRLEGLLGKRKGQHSIQVNDQYRLGIIWRNGDSFDIELADYR